MKLRLDEYYYIINYYLDDIEDYMPEELLCKIKEFEKSNTNLDIYDFVESLYSYITIINSHYEIIDIDLEKSYIQYQAIIKINNKYYSFEYYDTVYWNFDERVNVNQELIEVEPVEVKEIKYKPTNIQEQ